MISLDTNYLLRFLTNDVESQAETARKVIKESEGLYISTVVLAETVYYLRNHYKKDKNTICDELGLLVKQSNIKTEDYISLALGLYKSENISFYDCLFLAEALEEERQIRTFGQKLLKVFSKYSKD